jgi:hypothetical protein
MTKPTYDLIVGLCILSRVYHQYFDENHRAQQIFIRARVVSIYVCVHLLPVDGHRSGPKHVVVVHNKIEHE